MHVHYTQVASSLPFDNTTSKGFSSTDVQGALEELRDHTVFDSQTQATSTNGTLTLTSANTNLQFLTGSATGYSVKMPDATTLSLSAYYQIINQSSQTVSVKDSSGAVLFPLGQTSIGYLYLQLNGTAAGSWVYYQSAISAGIQNYNVVSSTIFTSNAAVDTLITGMTITPVAGTYAIWFNGQITGTGSGQQTDVTLYNGGSAIADSKRSGLSPAGTHIYQLNTQTVSQFNGTNACAVYVNPNSNSDTITGRSLLLIRLGP